MLHLGRELVLQSFKLKESDITVTRLPARRISDMGKVILRKPSKCEACGTPVGQSQNCPNPTCKAPRHKQRFVLLRQIPLPYSGMSGPEEIAAVPSKLQPQSHTGVGHSPVQPWGQNSYLDEVSCSRTLLWLQDFTTPRRSYSCHHVSRQLGHSM